MEQEIPLETATLAGGCFWCIEAVFSQIKGVEKAVSGYTGGQPEYPTYEEVCSDTTGHAEAVQVHFHPDVISFKEILMIFFASHDPTMLNRQGADIGTQYRSEVFYAHEKQRMETEETIEMLNSQKIFSAKIVTKIEPAGEFYEAEDYHQHYFRKNPHNGYCHAVINPKISKIRKEFSKYLI
jgi:peptide-methionine (S)-S-oxide reductase